ncbi:ribokinase [Mesorhizobium sp. CAU 1732]|uniref:ribokinase n=1 Tax=Mesorhizobium sp. CAU 1732 TaxID=3140358 RepID=UPI003261B506
MITVVGSINLDLIATVDRLPKPGETVPGDAFTTSPGGKGANQALAARRSGADVRMVGGVGRDSFATEALACLRDGGVDLSGVRESHAATGVALIFVEESGENVITIVPGGNGALFPGDVASADIRKGEYVMLQLEVPLETVGAALAATRSVGATSLLNTAPFRAEAAPLLGEADYVIANETEFDLYSNALSLTGDSREQRMLDFAGRTGRIMVVTLGAEGVVAATASELVRAQGLTITPVDTVGAGDTFCGYFAASLELGLPLQDALRRAAVAGSLACLKPGAQPSIPRGEDVEEALKGG